MRITGVKTLRVSMLAVVLMLWLVPEVSYAINCRIWVFRTNFGLYMPQRPTPIDRTGLMLLRCVGSPGSFSIVMGPGASGDQLNRSMFSSPSNALDYNIFRDPARTLIWGDGTPPTVTLSGVRNRRGRPSWFFYPYFGRVFANQAPGSGIYSDNMLVTVLF